MKQQSREDASYLDVPIEIKTLKPERLSTQARTETDLMILTGRLHLECKHPISTPYALSLGATAATEEATRFLQSRATRHDLKSLGLGAQALKKQSGGLELG